MRNRTVNRLAKLLDIVDPLPVTDGLQKVFGVTRESMIDAIIDAIDLGLCMCQRTQNGVSIVADECLSEHYLAGSDAVAAMSQAIGLREVR